MTPLQNQYSAKYGPGDYVPNVFIQYWGMRVMAYLGGLVWVFALWGAWLLWRKRLETSRLFLFAATWAVITPFLMNTAGWLLTESGRQPWIVQGLMLTKNGISPSSSFTYLVISVVIFIALYLILAALFLVFMLRYSRREPDPDPSLARTGDEPDARVPSMLY